MNIDIKPATGMPEVTCVAISGRIDNYTVEKVREEIGSLLNIGANKLCCNLAQVEFVSGSGLKLMLKSMQQARAQGGDFKICAARPEVAKLFKLAGFTDVARLYRSERAALVAFASPEQDGKEGDDQAYMKTFVADDSAGEAYMKTFVADEPPGEAYMKTFVADEPSEQNYMKTFVAEEPTQDVGYMKTFVETPATDKQSTLVDDASARFAAKGAGRDPMEELRDKLRAAASGSTRAGDAAEPEQEGDFQAVLDNIDTLAGTLESGPGENFVGVSPIAVRISAKKSVVEPLVSIFGAVGALSGIGKLEMVKAGVAAAEVLKAIARTVPNEAMLQAEVAAAEKQVALTLRTPGAEWRLYDILRPQSDPGVDSAAKAEKWLKGMLAEAKVDADSGTVTLVGKAKA